MAHLTCAAPHARRARRDRRRATATPGSRTSSPSAATRPRTSTSRRASSTTRSSSCALIRERRRLLASASPRTPSPTRARASRESDRRHTAEKLARGRLRHHPVLLRRRPLLRPGREPPGARRRQAGDPRDHAGHEHRQRQADGRAAGLRVPGVARRQARTRSATTRPRCARVGDRGGHQALRRRCSTAARRACTSTR